MTACDDPKFSKCPRLSLFKSNIIGDSGQLKLGRHCVSFICKNFNLDHDELSLYRRQQYFINSTMNKERIKHFFPF